MDKQLVSPKEVDRYAFKNEYVIIDIRSPPNSGASYKRCGLRAV